MKKSTKDQKASPSSDGILAKSNPEANETTGKNEARGNDDVLMVASRDCPNNHCTTSGSYVVLR